MTTRESGFRNLSPEPSVWLVRGGRHGEDEAAALDLGLAILGFLDIPDLAGARTPEEVLNQVRQALPDAGENRVRNFASQLTAFVLTMQEGDIVVLPLKTTGQIALGRVAGPYRFAPVGDARRHTRPVQWLRTDVPRSDFQQDLLYSLGAFMTVCRISRNEAGRRIAAVLQGGTDPGVSPAAETAARSEKSEAVETPQATEAPVDLPQLAQDQIVQRITERFHGHDFAYLIDAVLQAEGFTTLTSDPGPDGGVDILAARGALGFDGPHLCVQVKSSRKPEDVNTLRALQGTMHNHRASQGLLVSWGGFNRAVHREAKQSFFNVRLWSAADVVEAIYRVYDRLPKQIQAELPLKRIWVLVLKEEEE